MHRAAQGFVLAFIATPYACSSARRPATPVGTWAAEFWLDSSGPLDSTPTARRVSGRLTIGDTSARLTAFWPDTSRRVPERLGNYDVDFSPFFGSAVAPDAGTTVVGRTSGTFATELTAALDSEDSLHLTLIPRLDHGGIDATGFLAGDSVTGHWDVRSSAGGATGHFRLTLISSSPPPVRRDPPPSPPKTLALVERGTILVRIQDVGTHGYLTMRHALRKGDGTIYSWSVGDSADGWGPPFWLPPGTYSVVVDEIPCGDSTQFLAREIDQPFKARAGDTTRVTVRIAIAR